MDFNEGRINVVDVFEDLRRNGRVKGVILKRKHCHFGLTELNPW